MKTSAGGPWPYVFCISPVMRLCMQRPSRLVQLSAHAKRVTSGQETLGRHVDFATSITGGHKCKHRKEIFCAILR